jgi:hypothetical protein
VNNFAVSGDSGAIVCLGGPGDILVDPNTGACGLLQEMSSGFGITDAPSHAGELDEIRDKYFATFPLGALIVSLYYMNQNTILTRIQNTLNALSANPQALATVQSYAQSYYNQYEPILLGAFDDPPAGGTFTADDYNQMTYVTYGAYEYGFITYSEYNVTLAYLENVVQPTIGMNYVQMHQYAATNKTFKQTLK